MRLVKYIDFTKTVQTLKFPCQPDLSAVLFFFFFFWLSLGKFGKIYSNVAGVRIKPLLIKSSRASHQS